MHNGGPSPRLRFSHVSGIFEHDTQPTGPEKGFRAKTLPQLGIIHRKYPTDNSDHTAADQTQWQRLDTYIRHLNQESNEATYKLLFVARHGQGVHNVKEKMVGRHEWERYWARLDGDEHMTWADAHLTDQGVHETEELGRFWEDAVRHAKMPAPQRYFVSPLARCLETAQHTFSGLTLASDHPFRPTIKEPLRETSGVHTCNRRRTKSWIESHFPAFEIEPDFAKQDPLWDASKRETPDEVKDRLHSFLQQLFETNSDDAYISVTAHTGSIRALYAAVGHPDVWVGAGTLFPILIRAEKQV